MKTMRNRIVCCLAVICMLVSMLPVVASADNSLFASESSLSAKRDIVGEAVFTEVGPFSDGYAPVCDQNGLWGYVNEAGEMVVECKYDWANYCSEGLALVGMYESVYSPELEEYFEGTQLYLLDMKGGEIKLDLSERPCLVMLDGFDFYYQYNNGVANAYGIPFTAEGKPIRAEDLSALEIDDHCYDFVVQTGPSVNGLIPMSTNGMGQMPAYQTFIMDTEGKIVKTFAPTDELGRDGVSKIWPTENGLYIIQSSRGSNENLFVNIYTYGIMDASGAWVVEDGAFADFKYMSNGEFFLGGLLVVMDENGKYGAINEKGEQVIDFRYDAMSPFSGGYAPVVLDGRAFYVDTAGKEYHVAAAGGEAAVLTQCGMFEDGIASVCDGEGKSYLISDQMSNGMFIPVKDSEGMNVIGADFYEADGLYGVCMNSLVEEETNDPEAQVGDSFIYVNGVRLELSKPILDIYEITCGDYVLLPEEEQDEWGNLRELVETRNSVYVLEKGTQISFPFGYTWGASRSYMYYEEDGFYAELSASGGYTPDYWYEEVVLPVVWTLDKVNEGYVWQFDLTELCMDADGEYIYDDGVLRTNHVGRVFYDIRETEEKEPEHTHKYESLVTEPTCVDEGYTTHTCTCGDSYTDSPVAATGHKWDEGKVTKEATEEAEGEKTFTCTACGETKTEKIAKLSHTHKYESLVTAPTCTEEGYTTHTCPCGDSYVDSKLAALDHKWDQGKVVKEPEIWTDGLKVYTCTVCGDEREEPIDKLAGHDPTPTPDPDPIENPFADVSEKDYFFEPVMWAVQNSVTSGLSANSFGPAAGCTRAQVVTFLWRAAGEPAPKSSENPFKDVAEGQYYYDAVLWAVENGITTGLSADSFGPNANCNRGQIVTFLWRAKGEPAPGSSANPFADVAESQYYYDAVLWAVEKGITTGMSANSFAPNATCTRGQIVTFLYRGYN